MIKILHSADWHMDAPLRAFTPEQRRYLRERMLRLPGQIADLCIREGCDVCLLAGDVFDGPYTREGYEAVYRALERMEIPVFIAPGNHDPYTLNSPWNREIWPENVRIFTKQEPCSFRIPHLDCRVYGAAFTAAEAPGLLAGFQARCGERHALLVLHGDPTSAASPYNPVTAAQIRDAGVDYAALGHIHAGGRFAAGGAVCAWPGCPMGRGWDETGIKGVLVVDLDEGAEIRFCPLEVPRFYDMDVPVGRDPAAAVAAVLPGGGSRDFYRIHLMGERADKEADLPDSFPGYPNLTIVDERICTASLAEEEDLDGFRGNYFRFLREAATEQPPETVRILELAEKISRQILSGREVELP